MRAADTAIALALGTAGNGSDGGGGVALGGSEGAAVADLFGAGGGRSGFASAAAGAVAIGAVGACAHPTNAASAASDKSSAEPRATPAPAREIAENFPLINVMPISLDCDFVRANSSPTRLTHGIDAAWVKPRG